MHDTAPSRSGERTSVSQLDYSQVTESRGELIGI